MLERFGFVMVDVTLKLFFFVFTYQASLLLSRADFDLLSYFRSTLTMCMGALTSTAGLYFLVYGKKMHGSAKYGRLYGVLPAVFFMALLILVMLILTMGAELFKLGAVFERMGWLNFFSAILVASAAQAFLIYKKAAGKVTARLALLSVFGLLLVIAPGTWLLSSQGVIGAAYYICLGYGVLLILFASQEDSVAHAMPSRRGLRSRTACLVTLSIAHKFLLPNFIETLFSILAPWLAVYALVANSGMHGVGALLFYQALIGLPVFIIYSLTLNDHALYDRSSQGGAMALGRFRNMYVAFYGLVTLSGGGFSPELKHLLKLDDVSNLSAVSMFAATLLQAELISKGMVFKKAGESTRTMRHNVIYSLSLCAGSVALTKIIGIDGYALAILVAWLLTYLYVSWDFQRTFHLKGQTMWLEVGLLMAGFCVLVHRTDVPLIGFASAIVGLLLLVGYSIQTMVARRRA